MVKQIAQWIKNSYAAPSPEALALRELENARRGLLEAHSGREYAEAMCKYHDARIKRLTAYLHTVTEVQS